MLAAPDREALLDWVRQQRLAAFDEGWLVVHAGVAPQWDRDQTLALAAEVEAVLRGPGAGEFLAVMYGNEPACWSPALDGPDRLRYVVNVLTRIRFCDADGCLDFHAKAGADAAPAGYAPWFKVPGRRTLGQPVAFGHWSALGLVNRPDLLALDTGCVWGGSLTAVRVDGGRRDVAQVPLPAAAPTGRRQACRPASPRIESFAPFRKRGRAVEGTGLENRRRGDPSVGSNPTASAGAGHAPRASLVFPSFSARMKAILRKKVNETVRSEPHEPAARRTPAASRAPTIPTARWATSWKWRRASSRARVFPEPASTKSPPARAPASG